jgi:hypothetical protein
VADTLYSNVVGNTVASNDSTGIAGNLFNTMVGTTSTGATTAVPNPAGISTETTSAALLAVAPGNAISDPHLVNNIVWHNRSFFFNMNGGLPTLSPSNSWADAIAAVKPSLGTPAANGCVLTAVSPASADVYWDVGVVGDTSANPAAAVATTRSVASATQGNVNGNRTVTITTTAPLGLPAGATFNVTITGVTGNNNGRYNVTSRAATVTGASSFSYQPTNGGVSNGNFANLGFGTATAAYTPPAGPAFPAGNSVLSAGNPNLLKPYCNASRALPGLQFEPGTPFQPAFTISVSATLDESGNFVDLHFGPLSLQDQATGTSFNGDYHLAGASGDAWNAGGATAPANVGTYSLHDFDGDVRPLSGAFDKGADELHVPTPIATLSPASLTFSGVQGVATATQAVTLTNTGDAPLSAIVVGAPTGSFAQANNCPATLAVGSAACTITVSFTATALGNNYTGTLSITDNAVASPQAVSLGGSVVARNTRAGFAPSPVNWNRTQTGANTDRTVTLTADANNNAPVVLVAAPAVTGNFSIIAGATSTCAANVSLAAGQSCTLRVRHTANGGTGTLSVLTDVTNPANANGVVSDNLVGNN